MEEPAILPCEGKLAFGTEREARAAVIVAEHQHGVKLKVYQCHYCDLWHLSSAS